MACGGGCHGKVYNGNCTDYTESDFTFYRDKYQCIKDGNLYGQVGMTSAYVQSRIDTLNNMIADKQNNPLSCNYRDYIAAIVIDIQNITVNTDC